MTKVTTCFRAAGRIMAPNASAIPMMKPPSRAPKKFPIPPKTTTTKAGVRKAYPTYDANYRKNLETVKEYLNGLKNLYTVGRNGMHMYNNQDHSMLTAMYAVENIEGAGHDIWSVNADQEYHETEAQASGKKDGR